MWEACKNSKNTLLIVKTNFDKIIGGYATVTMNEGEYSVKNTEAFTFYYDDDHIKVLTKKDGFKYYVCSDSNWFLYLDEIIINHDRKDITNPRSNYWNLPSNIGYAKKDNGLLYISGANDGYFSV